MPTCKIGEDLVFSDDNKTCYLTCKGSQNAIVGNATTDKVKGEIKLPKPYPHGFAVHNGIDRALVTSTVWASDLGDAGETITGHPSQHKPGPVHPQGLQQALALARGSGGATFRAALESARCLRDQHVRRQRLSGRLGPGEEGLQGPGGV